MKETLNTIAKAFELGTVLSFRIDKYNVDGYNVVFFNTSTENGLKYIYRT